MTASDRDAFATTRRSLHVVAEELMAGPQYRVSATIRLRVSEGGIETVELPTLRLDGETLALADRVAELDGRTVADVARQLDLVAGPPVGAYPRSQSDRAEESLVVDPSSVHRLMAAFEVGQAALTAFAPDQIPVLWPEHFDLGIQRDEVNYGLSGGDSYHEFPYAYVGPWSTLEGDFWNAPFGAARPVGPHTEAVEILEFFGRGRELARG